jgi:hypothetical protein
VARAVTMFQMLYRKDPDNSAVAAQLKRARAMDSGKESGNTAFKEGRFQEAHDQCAPLHLPQSLLCIVMEA